MSQVALAALVSGLLILAQHYFPWGMLLRRRLPRLAAYGLGLGAVVGPLAGLFGWWLVCPPVQPWAYLVALWAVSGAGGLATVGAYAVDWVLGRLVQAHELEELLAHEQAQRRGA